MKILLIGVDGVKISNSITYEDALKIAKDKGLDLILVNESNKIYKLGDRGKLEFERKRKEKKQRMKQQRSQKIKEVQIGPNIGNDDLETKMRQIKSFLSSGLKTRLVMKFKKSQANYKDIGLQKVNALISQLTEAGLITPNVAKTEGNNIFVWLVPVDKT